MTTKTYKVSFESTTYSWSTIVLASTKKYAKLLAVTKIQNMAPEVPIKNGKYIITKIV